MVACGEETKSGTTKKIKKPAKPKSSDPPKTVGYSAPILEFPHILRIIGPKQIRIMMNFVPSAICYTLTSLLLFTYMAEWKGVLQYLPYYNGKYVVEDTNTQLNVEESGEEGKESVAENTETVETPENTEEAKETKEEAT